MNKTTYRNAMMLISAEKEEILMKAKQMQAQYDAQNKRTIKQHSTRRGMLAGIAAAAAVLVCGAVTVGAVNDWNYAAVFSKYLSDKSGMDVSYDFTGMGLDIGQTFEGEDHTLTVQSVVADAFSLYIFYDIALGEKMQALIADEPTPTAHYGLYASVTDPDGTSEYSKTGRWDNSIYDSENDVFHCMYIADLTSGDTFFGKELKLYSAAPDVWTPTRYSNDPEDGRYHLSRISEDAIVTADLSEIEVQLGLEAECSVILPTDIKETEFDTMYISQIQIMFRREWWYADYNVSLPQFMGDARDITFTMIYADGTELTRNGFESSDGGASLNDGGYDCYIKTAFTFMNPIDLDGLVAVRIGDTEIPVQ